MHSIASEIIMPFAGYLVHTGQLKLIWVATAGAIGCNLGSVVAYWIGALGGRPFIMKYGRFVLLNHHDLDARSTFLQPLWRHHRFSGTAAACRAPRLLRSRRALPGCRSYASLYTFIGSCHGATCLAYVGMKLGQACPPGAAINVRTTGSSRPEKR